MKDYLKRSEIEVSEKWTEISKEIPYLTIPEKYQIRNNGKLK